LGIKGFDGFGEEAMEREREEDQEIEDTGS
jgi:hypothetical protein